MHYVISSIRFAYDGKTLRNTHPVVNWLNGLGQPLYGRQTPDGYPLNAAAWSSSGQISRRFEIARAIGAGNSGLFEPEDGSAPETTGFPQLLDLRLYYATFEPHLSAQARSALDSASLADGMESLSARLARLQLSLRGIGDENDVRS